jgi:hypothetical protein
MMLMLFLDDITSERELVRIIPERLDYLVSLGYGLDHRTSTTTNFPALQIRFANH